MRRLAGFCPLVLAVGALSASTTGCALARVPPPTPAATRATAAEPSPAIEQIPENQPDVPDGVFHQVESGQTLWRIARAYGVPLERIVAANRLGDPSELAAGSMLFVPGASVLLNVLPYPAPPPIPPPVTPGPNTIDSQRAEACGFVWPVAGGEVISRFGAQRVGRRHAGIDIRGPSGQEILAAEAGEVAYSGSEFGGYGKMVILDHGGGLETVYAHASHLLVRQGDHVERGQPVARVGRTGNATTEHCHFELRQDKTPIDPLSRFEVSGDQVARADPEARPKSAGRKKTRAHGSARTRGGSAPASPR